GNEASTSRARSRANSFAVAAPMPLPAPVITPTGPRSVTRCHNTSGKYWPRRDDLLLLGARAAVRVLFELLATPVRARRGALADQRALLPGAQVRRSGSDRSRTPGAQPDGRGAHRPLAAPTAARRLGSCEGRRDAPRGAGQVSRARGHPCLTAGN